MGGTPPPLQRSPVPHTVNMILSCKAGRREHVCGFAFIFMRLVSWTTGSSPSPEDCFIFDVWPDSLCLSKSKGVARNATIWNIVYIGKQNWVCKYLSCSQESLRNSSELAALVPLDRCDWVQDINPWRRTTMGPVCLSFSKETGSSYLLGAKIINHLNCDKISQDLCLKSTFSLVPNRIPARPALFDVGIWKANTSDNKITHSSFCPSSVQHGKNRVNLHFLTYLKFFKP